ncbi:MAG: undecaprenyldiphospho-muramoylpentapeptide beta-N-acetylglucosaminyltransferase [Candidatus Omnitrophica bacterium]|nr:undecaprenyldiphospho-muramoylpentapeptide beta-N-acetylglucosaminyltransferase [Candidatus Omnitrophota bacterium]
MKVILAAGGSGGHIFPSVALAHELEKKGLRDIFFVSSKRRLDRNILKDVGHECFFLSVNPMPLRFRPLRVIGFILKIITDTFASLYILARVKPDVVVGFGGYSSGTIVALAKMFRIPVLIHEQNLLPGRANRILSRFADRIATSFPGSGKYFQTAGKNVVYSGNPLRVDMLSNDRRRSAERLGLDPDKFTVLVMGGSQGSTFLNRTASEAAKLISDQKGGSIQFVHLTGRNDIEQVREYYRLNAISAKAFSFLDQVDDAYAVSDLAISRSGAAAVFELALYGKPMILIPYPNPKNNQRYNAKYFQEAGAALYREEKALTSRGLAEDVVGLVEDERKRSSISRAAKSLSVPDAGRKLAEEVIKLANENE